MCDRTKERLPRFFIECYSKKIALFSGPDSKLAKQLDNNTSFCFKMHLMCLSAERSDFLRHVGTHDINERRKWNPVQRAVDGLHRMTAIQDTGIKWGFL